MTLTNLRIETLVRNKASLYTFLMMNYSLKLLIAILAVSNTNAFFPSSASRNSISRVVVTRGAQAASMAMDQDSEWYCPPPTPKPTKAANVKQTPLATVEELGSFLAGTEQNELVLIKFHASWCRSCAKFGRKLDQLASEYSNVKKRNGGSRKHELKIGTVEYMEGRKICQALQIEALPTVHMYCRQQDGTLQKVQDFSCPPSQFHKVQDYCKYYLNRSTANDEEQEFAKALDRGHAMMETTLNDTKKAGKLRSGWKRLVKGQRAATGN